MAGKVLRHGVKARADGNAHLLCQLCRPAAQNEGQHDVDNVGPFDGLPDDIVVRLCQLYAVALHIAVEDAKIPGGHHGIAGYAPLLFVGAQNRKRVSLCFQTADEIHSRQGGTVVLLSQHVTDNGNSHVKSSFSSFFTGVL